nr:MAG TPA: Transcription initiation factor IIE, alpha FINGER, Transcription [Caudoviricetes sp.]
MSTVLSQIEEFALDDVQAAIDTINKRNKLNPPIEFIDMKHECNANTEKDGKYSIKFFADMSNAGDVFSCDYTYDVDGENVTLCDDLNKKVYSAYCRSAKVTASTRIVAADEDAVADSLDDLSDSVDDLQDDMEEIREDDPNIEIENNIENHFIAECGSCGGIFISAMLQSDQEIDHITGICPLCERETNQYLKWVIKKVSRKNPLEVEDDPTGEYSMKPQFAEPTNTEPQTGGAEF